MRWVALVAISANVLLAVWYFVIVRPAEQAQAQTVRVQPGLVMDERLPRVALLSELDAQARQAQGVIPIQAAPQGASQSPAPAECLIVGPIPERVTVAQLRQRFEAVGLDADFRVFDVKLAPSYWVYIPPYPTEEATRKVLKKLRAAKIDSFYVTDGEFQGGISLGVFSQEDSALKVQQERSQQGYPAVLRTLTRTRPEIWVGFRDPGPLSEESYWLDLLKDFPELSRRTVSCGAVASADKLP